MKKILFSIFGGFSLYLVHSTFLIRSAGAVCPVCTLAVASGLGLSRYFGISDAISGLWVGGLILSSSFWLIDWLQKKKPEFKISNFTAGRVIQFKIPVTIAMYLLVLLPLVWTGIIGHPFNTTVFGIDRLVFGITLGSLIFLLALWADKKVRKIKGKQLFAFQKVVFPTGSLLILSIVLYLLKL